MTTTMTTAATMPAMTLRTIPVIDIPIDAWPSLLAFGASDTAVLLATTTATHSVHTINHRIYKYRRQLSGLPYIPTFRSPSPTSLSYLALQDVRYQNCARFGFAAGANLWDKVHQQKNWRATYQDRTILQNSIALLCQPTPDYPLQKVFADKVANKLTVNDMSPCVHRHVEMKIIHLNGGSMGQILGAHAERGVLIAESPAGSIRGSP